MSRLRYAVRARGSAAQDYRDQVQADFGDRGAGSDSRAIRRC